MADHIRTAAQSTVEVGHTRAEVEYQEGRGLPAEGAITGKPTVRSEVNVTPNKLVSEGLLARFRANLDASHRSDWVPEVSLVLADGADLSTVLGRVDAALRPLGPVMLTWEWALEADTGEVPAPIPQQTRH